MLGASCGPRERRLEAPTGMDSHMMNRFVACGVLELEQFFVEPRDGSRRRPSDIGVMHDARTACRHGEEDFDQVDSERSRAHLPRRRCVPARIAHRGRVSALVARSRRVRWTNDARHRTGSMRASPLPARAIGIARSHPSTDIRALCEPARRATQPRDPARVAAPTRTPAQRAGRELVVRRVAVCEHRNACVALRVLTAKRARPRQRLDPTGLHLDAHDRAAIERDDVDLGEHGRASAAENAPAASTQITRGDLLAPLAELAIVGRAPARERPRCSRDQQRAPRSRPRVARHVAPRANVRPLATSPRVSVTNARASRSNARVSATNVRANATNTRATTATVRRSHSASRARRAACAKSSARAAPAHVSSSRPCRSRAPLRRRSIGWRTARSARARRRRSAGSRLDPGAPRSCRTVRRSS